MELLPIDYGDAESRYRVEPASALTPEAIYERRWALALLERAPYVPRSRGYAHGGAPTFGNWSRRPFRRGRWSTRS